MSLLGYLTAGVGVRCPWAAPALKSTWCSWVCTAQRLTLGPCGIPRSTGGSGRLVHLHLSGFTSNFLSYLYPQTNILFVHFLKENLFLHLFHIQFFGWFGFKHYTCWERNIFIFGGLWVFLSLACSCGLVVCSP